MARCGTSSSTDSAQGCRCARCRHEPSCIPRTPSRPNSRERLRRPGAETRRAPIAFYTDPVAHLAADPLHLKDIDPNQFDIPVVVNDSVVKWLKYFTGPGRKWYGKWLARSGKYWPMMHEKLDAAGLPPDMVFLSMIESGYATHAYSHASAVGLWQFMAATGKGYDLRVDWWVDERRNPERATDAAIEYLTHLKKRYGHWYLAWAAYNAGPTV